LISILLASAVSGDMSSFGAIWQDILTDFANIGQPGALAAFLQVLMIDLVLAGDNAIVVGALAAGLPAEQRRKVILIGVLAALVLRMSSSPAVILPHWSAPPICNSTPIVRCRCSKSRAWSSM